MEEVQREVRRATGLNDAAYESLREALNALVEDMSTTEDATGEDDQKED